MTPYGTGDLGQHWLREPSHYLNQCWLIISKVQWHLSEGTFTTDTSTMNHLNYLSEIALKLPRGQWVKYPDSSGLLHWHMIVRVPVESPWKTWLKMTNTKPRPCVNYHQISNISHIKYKNLNVSRLGLQLSFCSVLKPGVKSRMKMQLDQCRQTVLQLHLSDQQFYCLIRCFLY